MKREFLPLSVVPAVPSGSGIRFLHPKEQYDVGVMTPIIWALLAEANGYQSVEAIGKKIVKQFPEVSIETIEAIFGDLRSLGVVTDSREAHKHFHELSVNPMFYSQPVTFADIAEYTASERLSVADGEVTKLEGITDSTLTVLQDVRRSCRSFSDSSVTVAQVGHVLTRGYSVERHATPSAGGLYPVKIYFIVTRDQDGLAKGYYEYNPENETCVRYQEEVDVELLQYAFDSDTLLYGAPVIVVIAADMERHSGKYSNRGYRYTLIEVGHVAQNMQLASTEAGLSALEYGGFLDSVLATELGVERPRVTPLIALGLGVASQDSTFNAMHLLEDLESQLVGRNKPVRHVGMSSGNHPEKGETFFAASALYKPSPNQDTKRSYRQRFSGGTATSAGLAQVKALAEAYERYASGLVRVDRLSKATGLSERWLDPRRIVPLTDTQLQKLPFLQQFDPNQQWEWVCGKAAASGEAVWVPVDLAFYPLNNDTFNRKLAHEASSSGVAAWRTFDGAAQRGLLELIERDVVMRNWFARKPPLQVSHERLPYHWRRRAQYWESQGRSVRILNMSAYGAIVVNVVITSPDAFPCFINGSAASAISFNEAVAKAFHEAEYGLLQALQFSPHRPIRPERVIHPMDHAKLYAHPKYLDNLSWLWAGEVSSEVPVATVTADDLLTKLDAVLVRLSPQDAPLHVVRVLSEQLVPISFGFSTEHYAHPTIMSNQIHPDSLLLPHYFA